MGAVISGGYERIAQTEEWRKRPATAPSRWDTAGGSDCGQPGIALRVNGGVARLDEIADGLDITVVHS
jgi:hypothetical protein